MMISLVALVIILGGIFTWQMAVWFGEVRDKRRKYRAALVYMGKDNLRLLVVGGPWGARRGRRMFKMAAHGDGDVCLDIDRNAITGCRNAIQGDVMHLPFPDNTFGAVFISHVLEHLPTTEDAGKALRELHRVAGKVFVVYPSRQSIAAWLTPGHHLWVWQKSGATYLKQRGEIKEVLVEAGKGKLA